jgi:hypothetical protein
LLQLQFGCYGAVMVVVPGRMGSCMLTRHSRQPCMPRKSGMGVWCSAAVGAAVCSAWAWLQDCGLVRKLSELSVCKVAACLCVYHFVRGGERCAASHAVQGWQNAWCLQLLVLLLRYTDRRSKGLEVCKPC